MRHSKPAIAPVGRGWRFGVDPTDSRGGRILGNPASPVLSGTYNTPDSTRSVAVAGDHAFCGPQVSDVPDDQGGRVYVHVTRSGYDFADETTLPVTQYGVYRRVDGSPLSDEGGFASAGTSTPDHAIAAIPGVHSVWRSGTRFVHSTESQRGGGSTFPPGTWALVATVPATQSDSYLVEATTEPDSTASGGVDCAARAHGTRV